MAWIAPVVAAAAKRRHEEEEEEEMAVHLQAELGTDWEFKIVRGSLGIFGNPQKLGQMLEDEARSGWKMAGKLDDNRVFLKRPKTARERDHLAEPGVDPYRTYYGGLSNWSVALVIAGLLVFGLLVAAAVVLGRIGLPLSAAPRMPTILVSLVVAGILGLLVVVVTASR
jgi:hypothetical protein